jgi:hypothetical protein
MTLPRLKLVPFLLFMSDLFARAASKLQEISANATHVLWRRLLGRHALKAHATADAERKDRRQ